MVRRARCLLTVSSPGAGDGKSLVSSNLAVSFGEAGYKTLLIDGDIRRGELHRMFGVDRRPGLLDYLTGQATIDGIIRPTPHKGLSVIPCGTRRHHGPELLGSAAMVNLMAAMKSRYNVVIVDSPPLGAGIDPFVLGTATGHLMLVFRSGETDRQMADAKLRLLDRLPVRVLGAVLNDIQAQGIYRYYSYLYGYTADEDCCPAIGGEVGRKRERSLVEGSNRELFEGPDPIVVAFSPKMTQRRGGAQQHLDRINWRGCKVGNCTVSRTNPQGVASRPVRDGRSLKHITQTLDHPHSPLSFGRRGDYREFGRAEAPDGVGSPTTLPKDLPNLFCDFQGERVARLRLRLQVPVRRLRRPAPAGAVPPRNRSHGHGGTVPACCTARSGDRADFRPGSDPPRAWT